MKKILYVEDDALIAGLYSQKLMQAGFEVLVVEDGLAAMKQLLAFKPDLVVLDLLLPKMTGADVLKFMCGRPELKSTRVVVFSNSFLSSLTEQVAAAKVERALVKSTVTPAQLVSVVNEVLEIPASTPVELSPGATLLGDQVTVNSGAAVPAAAVGAPPAMENEVRFRERVRRDFFGQKSAIIKSIREICRQFIETAEASSQPQRLEDLTRKMGFLAQMSGLAGCHRMAQLASALEALLLELQNKPALINDSSRQTIAVTVAFLVARLDSTIQPEEETPAPLVLVVDDDAVSSRTLVLSLSRANLRATAVTDPFDALKALETTPYDLVLLDINMPGMDGIALCERMRAMPLHKRTSVIFVTGYTDFKTRARSILSGGDDLIAKPVLPIELVVKAITLLLKKTYTISPTPAGGCA